MDLEQKVIERIRMAAGEWKVKMKNKTRHMTDGKKFTVDISDNGKFMVNIQDCSNFTVNIQDCRNYSINRQGCADGENGQHMEGKEGKESDPEN